MVQNRKPQVIQTQLLGGNLLQRNLPGGWEVGGFAMEGFEGKGNPALPIAGYKKVILDAVCAIALRFGELSEISIFQTAKQNVCGGFIKKARREKILFKDIFVNCFLRFRLI